LPNDETSEDVRLPEMAARRDSEQRVRPKENYHMSALLKINARQRTERGESRRGVGAKACRRISHLPWYLTGVSATF
jgi:hypothetical protein